MGNQKNQKSNISRLLDELNDANFCGGLDVLGRIGKELDRLKKSSVNAFDILKQTESLKKMIRGSIFIHDYKGQHTDNIIEAIDMIENSICILTERPEEKKEPEMALEISTKSGNLLFNKNYKHAVSRKGYLYMCKDNDCIEYKKIKWMFGITKIVEARINYVFCIKLSDVEFWRLREI